MQSLTVQVNKKVKDEIEPRHAEFLYEFPESVDEAKEKYGESLTLQHIHDSITLDVQGPARKALEAAPANLTNEEYSSIVSGIMVNHKLNTKRTRGPSTPKISSYQQMAIDLADPEKKDAIIAKFRSLGINLELDGQGGDGATIAPQEEESSARRRR